MKRSLSIAGPACVCRSGNRHPACPGRILSRALLACPGAIQVELCVKLCAILTPFNLDFFVNSLESATPLVAPKVGEDVQLPQGREREAEDVRPHGVGAEDVDA